MPTRKYGSAIIKYSPGFIGMESEMGRMASSTGKVGSKEGGVMSGARARECDGGGFGVEEVDAG